MDTLLNDNITTSTLETELNPRLRLYKRNKPSNLSTPLNAKDKADTKPKPNKTTNKSSSQSAKLNSDSQN